MTNELEKQFFDTFGIKPKYLYQCEIRDTIEPDDEFLLPACSAGEVISFCTNKEYYNYCRVVEVKKIYPRITDRILLELILINMHNEDLFGYPTTVEELKHNTLKQLIETYNKFFICVTCDGEYQQTAREIKHQVRTLFEEDEWK